jgi:hypothetical protein
MSTLVARATHDAGMFWVPSGISLESAEVRQLETKYLVDRRVPTSFAWRGILVEQIAEILQTCSDLGWDGYDAKPVSLDSAGRVAEFVWNLPEGIRMPTVVPEPDGDIALEWRIGESLFSLSFTGRSLVYAGRFGGESQYGQEPFFAAIPRKILEILAGYFPAD